MELKELVEKEAAQEEEEVKNNRNNNNFGFTPEVKEVEKQKEVVVETEQMKKLKSKINKLLCRYPTLVPRSSRGAVEALNKYNEDELDNIYQNALTDLVAIRGTPTSEFAINAFCGTIDRNFLPGYLDVCLEDVELNRCIDGEMSDLLYRFGSKVEIFFRLVNNAYKIIYHRPMYPNKGPGGHNPHVTSIFDDHFEGDGGDVESYSDTSGSFSTEGDQEETGDYEEEESRRPHKRVRTGGQ